MTRRRFPKRWLGVTLAFGAVTVASAAAITVNDVTLAAGKAAIPACDSDGVSVIPVLASSTIASVDVSGIAGACGNGTLRVTVASSSTSGSGSASIPAGGGGPVNVAVSPTVTLMDATSVSLVLVGP